MMMKQFLRYTTLLLRTALLLGAATFVNVQQAEGQTAAQWAQMPDAFETMDPASIIGDGNYYYLDSVFEARRALIAPEHLRNLRADAACVLAASRQDEWMEAKLLTPIYLRAPQAERERKAGRDHTKPLRRQREEGVKL